MSSMCLWHTIKVLLCSVVECPQYNQSAEPLRATQSYRQNVFQRAEVATGNAISMLAFGQRAITHLQGFNAAVRAINRYKCGLD